MMFEKMFFEKMVVFTLTSLSYKVKCLLLNYISDFHFFLCFFFFSFFLLFFLCIDLTTSLPTVVVLSRSKNRRILLAGKFFCRIILNK